MRCCDWTVWSLNEVRDRMMVSIYKRVIHCTLSASRHWSLNIVSNNFNFSSRLCFLACRGKVNKYKERKIIINAILTALILYITLTPPDFWHFKSLRHSAHCAQKLKLKSAASHSRWHSTAFNWTVARWDDYWGIPWNKTPCLLLNGNRRKKKPNSFMSTKIIVDLTALCHWCWLCVFFFKVY